MMGKISKVIAVLFVLYFMFYQNGYAGPFTKLGRGLTNIVTSPAELIYEPSALSQENNAWVAWLGGIPKGIIFIPIRVLAGAYDVATFPIPIPRNYDPLFEPATLIDGFQGLDL